MLVMSNTRLKQGDASGVAMVAALGLMAIASAVMMLLFMRTIDELQHGKDDAGIVQTLLVAHGGANLSMSLLRSDIQQRLDEIAEDLSDSTLSWSFGSSGPNATEPTPSSVAADLHVVANRLQSEIDALVCGDHHLADNQVLRLRIHVTSEACDLELPRDTRLGDGRFVQGPRRELGGEQRYALPFVVVAEGLQGEYRRMVVTQGEYQFDVGRRSFARYALFTDEHMTTSGAQRIWFTSDTIFDGPVHTNGNFNFNRRPWFGGEVTSAGATQGMGEGAFGFTSGGGNGEFFTADDLNPQGNTPDLSTTWSTNRPEFVAGVNWSSDYLPLPENAHDQHVLAGENGLLLTADMEYLELFAADSSGNPVGPNANPPAAYQYVVAGIEDGGSITYRISSGGVLERLNSGPVATWTVVTNRFNGVIYSEQYIPSLRGAGRVDNDRPNTARPALASFSKLTIVPAGGARITSDLVYEDQPCTGHLHRDGDNVVRARCENLAAENVLGIFAPTGNIEIGHNNGWNSDLNAPRDVRIQASILTSNGVVRVEEHDEGSTRGAVQLLGGIIEQRYGAFGTFSGDSMSSGYSRQFTFDPRLARGLTPPFFPTVGVDGVKQVLTFTYGHREQVY